MGKDFAIVVSFLLAGWWVFQGEEWLFPTPEIAVAVSCQSKLGASIVKDAMISGPSAPVRKHDCLPSGKVLKTDQIQVIDRFKDYAGNKVVLYEAFGGLGYLFEVDESKSWFDRIF